MIEKIPTLSDGDLASLFANALRLSQSGTKRQQDMAAQMIPALTEETEARAARAAAIKKAPRPKAKKKVVAEVTSDAAA